MYHGGGGGAGYTRMHTDYQETYSQQGLAGIGAGSGGREGGDTGWSEMVSYGGGGGDELAGPEMMYSGAGVGNGFME